MKSDESGNKYDGCVHRPSLSPCVDMFMVDVTLGVVIVFCSRLPPSAVTYCKVSKASPFSSSIRLGVHEQPLKFLMC